MNLADALKESTQSGSQQVNNNLPGGAPAGPWPGPQPGGSSASGGMWPGDPSRGAGMFSGGSSGDGGAGMFSGGNPSQPSYPAWPSPTPQPTAPGWPSPSPAPGPGPAPVPVVPTAPQRSLAVPFSQNIPGGLSNGKVITIAGIINPHADKITVDLCASKDIVFHFNPRFNEGGKQVIVRNHCIGNKWGTEERNLTHFPFTKGQPFEIQIKCINNEFQVNVNNSYLLKYKPQIRSLTSVNAIGIYYDLNLTGMNIR